MANKTTKTEAELAEDRADAIERHSKRMAKLAVTVGAALLVGFPDMSKTDLARLRAICLSATDAEFRPGKREVASLIDPLA